MNDNSARCLALVAACQARIEAYKARNALSEYNGEPPFYSEDYFQAEAHDIERLAREMLT